MWNIFLAVIVPMITDVDGMRTSWCEVSVTYTENHIGQKLVHFSSCSFSGFSERVWERLERNQRTLISSEENDASMVTHAKKIMSTISEDYGYKWVTGKEAQALRTKVWGV